MSRWSAVLLALAVATGSAGFIPATSAGAKTIARPKGGVITLVVKVDVYGDEGTTAPDGRPLDQYWQQVVMDTWGAAFDQYPYKGCYKVDLELRIQLRSRDADDRDGWHRVHVTAARTGNDWTGVGWAKVPETNRDPKTGDGTRSFENDQVGEIPVNAPPTVVAHEFGHAFGLGDDRKNGVAKPGREGTLMVGGARGVDPTKPLRIDQNLVDRIGKLIEQQLENEGKKLPDCESWTGTLRFDNDPCRATGYPLVEEGAVEVVVDAKGTAAGSGNLTNTEVGAPLGTPGACYSAVAPGSIQTPVDISGDRDRGALHLTVSVSPGFAVSLDLKVAGKTAKGETTVQGTTVTMTLECKACEDEAVG